MAINAKNVYIGTPEQSSTVGALSRGAVITTIPATYDAAVTAIASFTKAGYISEDGATLTIDKSTTDIIEWARNKVRRVLDSVDGTIGCTLIQFDEDDAKLVFGDEVDFIFALAIPPGTKARPCPALYELFSKIPFKGETAEYGVIAANYRA